MKYDVTFTEQAENDLRGIFEYIAFDLLSPENAAGQLDSVISVVDAVKYITVYDYQDGNVSNEKLFRNT